MNQVVLIGRLTKDPEIRTTTSQIPVATFTLAIDRPFKDASGNKQTDFIPCVAWRQTGEAIAKYVTKGQRLAVVGSMQVRSWDKDGQKHSVTEVIVDQFDFIERADRAPSQNAATDALPYEL